MASESDLFIFSDAPQNETTSLKVEEVRKYIYTIAGFRSVQIIEREKNYGLANSIINGVNFVLNKYERIIVLEDDLILSPHFLKYMNDALELYSNEEDVVSIHGYIYPVRTKLPETFFLRGADCWGWATWKRGWELFNPDTVDLINQLKDKKLINEFNLNGAYNNFKMLQNQARGKIDSWAIRWHASAFLKNMLTLYPGRSLVKNIGFDLMGTHTKSMNVYDTIPSRSEIMIKAIPVEVNIEARKEIEKFFTDTQDSLIKKLMRKIKTA
jgi:GR25 family glycosyltransferase involved in LPS biosynthesis